MVEKAAELRVKHLEMVQALVTRMGSYGASFKSYCIAVVTAVLGFAFTLKLPAVAALAILPLVAFALVDAQYLRVERRFRALFNMVRQEPWDTLPTFEIDLKKAPDASFWGAFASWSILGFYATLGACIAIAIIGARCL